VAEERVAAGAGAAGAAEAVRLVVCDLDGTLVDRADGPAPGAAEALHELQAAGVLLMICTGRRPAVAAPVIDRLRLHPDILGSFHGGVIHDLRGDVPLRHLHIPEDPAAAVQWALRQRGLDVSTYREGERRLVTRIVATGGIQAVAGAREVIDRLGLRGVRLDLAGGGWLDFRHPLAVKEQAVAFIARRLEIPLERVAAAGDDPSDAGMLRIVGRPIAVGDEAGPLRGLPATFVSPAGLAACLRALLD